MQTEDETEINNETNSEDESSTVSTTDVTTENATDAEPTSANQTSAALVTAPSPPTDDFLASEGEASFSSATT
jgi:hypothetical protein